MARRTSASLIKNTPISVEFLRAGGRPALVRHFGTWRPRPHQVMFDPSTGRVTANKFLVKCCSRPGLRMPLGRPWSRSPRQPWRLGRTEECARCSARVARHLPHSFGGTPLQRVRDLERVCSRGFCELRAHAGGGHHAPVCPVVYGRGRFVRRRPNLGGAGVAIGTQAGGVKPTGRRTRP